MYMIAHRSRNADATRRTFGLESRRHIHRVPMQISPVGNRVAKVDPDAEADGSIGRLISVVDRDLLLHHDGTAHRSIDAIKHDEQRVAARLDDPAAMLIDRRVYQVGAECPQAFECSLVIQSDQAAVAHHVRIDDRHQLPPVIPAKTIR